MRWWWQKAEQKNEQFETTLQRLIAQQLGSGSSITPETCLKSPTVMAIVTAVSRRISSTPVHIYQEKGEGDKETKTKIKDHPIAKLLKNPNNYQTKVDYFNDLASCLVRYGRYIAVIGKGNTGPIRSLDPINPQSVEIKKQNFNLTFKTASIEYPKSKIHYIRGPSTDFFTGISPVEKVKTAIALEVACEEYGMSFFDNGAMPLLIFKYATNMGFKTPEDEKKFISDFQMAFSGSKRNKAMFMPKGIEGPDSPKIENDKAQFLETRKFYQTVIAGAWGIPPHFVGNLENAHYNNLEQSDRNFDLNVILPYICSIESAMERDLLTEKDRNNGIIIRFNLDATLRADYLTRMKSYEIQIKNSMKTPNECREREGDNPLNKPLANSLFYSANLIKEGDLPANRGTTNG